MDANLTGTSTHKKQKTNAAHKNSDATHVKLLKYPFFQKIVEYI